MKVSQKIREEVKTTEQKDKEIKLEELEESELFIQQNSSWRTQTFPKYPTKKSDFSNTMILPAH